MVKSTINEGQELKPQKIFPDSLAAETSDYDAGEEHDP
jgi:hypothetical protein